MTEERNGPARERRAGTVVLAASNSTVARTATVGPAALEGLIANARGDELVELLVAYARQLRESGTGPDDVADAVRAQATYRVEPAVVEGILRRAANGHEPERPPAPGRASSRSTWGPVDLEPILSGAWTPIEPTLLTRSDGASLLYPGKLHLVSGEPESGKGWLACAACAEALEAGLLVVYIDFEDDEHTIVERLRSLGVDLAAIVDRFYYIRPAEPATTAEAAADLEALLAAAPGFVVFDGLTEALTLHGLSLLDNADVARLFGLAPRRFTRAGASVLMVDHVTRSLETRGRYAIGAQHKLAGVDVAFGAEVVKAFGRGQTGKVTLRVHKDRPGFIRPTCVGTAAATVELASTGGTVAVRLQAPDRGTVFRPTRLMERMSRALEEGGPMNVREARESVKGKHEARDLALRLLVSEGFVAVTKEGTAKMHASVIPYREADDDRARAES